MVSNQINIMSLSKLSLIYAMTKDFENLKNLLGLKEEHIKVLEKYKYNEKLIKAGLQYILASLITIGKLPRPEEVENYIITVRKALYGW